MPRTIRALLAALSLGALAVLTAPAHAATFTPDTPADRPFGGQGPACGTHSDFPDVRVCDGLSPAAEPERSPVESFDGAPLDTLVTLPRGDGPFPLVVFLHGYGGDKYDVEAYGARWARRGYAVLSFTARGFNGSCGDRSVRLSDPRCADVWIRLAHVAGEVRDTQHLTGLLADRGVIDPQRIGVTGISYGGGQSFMLATLRDRVYDSASESLKPWTSPGGLPMRIAAAAPQIGWSDLVYALLPNGRTLDVAVTDQDDDLRPLGVMKQSFVSGLYALGQTSGFYAPPGTDPQADLTPWYAQVNAGEPYDRNPRVEAIAEEIKRHHSAYYLPFDQPPAPLLIAQGWTDDLFPSSEALRYLNRLRARHPATPVALLFYDWGHQRASNEPADKALWQERAYAWFDHHVRGDGPAPGEQVEGLLVTCPREAGGAPTPSAGPLAAPSWVELHPGEVRAFAAEPQSVRSGSGDPDTARRFDPVAQELSGGADPCAETSRTSAAPGTATYRLPAAPEGGWTLLGSPTVIGTLDVTGPHAQVAARLWDVAPGGRSQRLVARGIFRPDASGQQTFQLNANGWRFEAGHVPKLELLGQDAPAFRASNGAFEIALRDVEVRLPVAERPGSRPGVLEPAPAVLPADAEPAPGVRRVERLGAATLATGPAGRRARVRVEVLTRTRRGARRRGLLVRLRCANRCTATLRASVNRRRAGRARATLRRGGARRVRLRLSRRTRRALRRSGVRVALRASARDAVGAVRLRPRRVRLR